MTFIFTVWSVRFNLLCISTTGSAGAKVLTIEWIQLAWVLSTNLIEMLLTLSSEALGSLSTQGILCLSILCMGNISLVSSWDVSDVGQGTTVVLLTGGRLAGFLLSIGFKSIELVFVLVLGLSSFLRLRLFLFGDLAVPWGFDAATVQFVVWNGTDACTTSRSTVFG